MLFGYNPQIIFVTFSQVHLAIFWYYLYQCEWTADTLWAQFLLQFYTDSLKLHWCFGHGLKYACGLDIILGLFLSLFSQVELSHFLGIIYIKVNGQGVHCGRNTAYGFIQILLKLHWCFGRSLRIYM